MIKRLWSALLLIWIGLVVSPTTYALTYAECSALRSDRDFAVSFNVLNALKIENVGVMKGVGGLNILPLNLWSDQAFTLFPKAIYDGSLDYFKNYKIWLEYRADPSGGANKTGTLNYYRVIGGSWSLLQSVGVNLAGVNSVHLAIYDTNVHDLACDTTSVSPPSLQNSKPEICDLFPQPVQSWVTAGSANYNYYGTSTLNITNSTVRINGWSDDYKDANTVQLHYSYDHSQRWNALRVGFDNVGDTWNAYNYKGVAICDGMGCFPGNDDGGINQRKIPAPPLVSAIYNSSTRLEIVDDSIYSAQGYNRVCSSSPTSSSVCSYQDLGNGNISITILKNLDSLYVHTYQGKTLTVHFADNIAIGRFQYERGVNAYFDENKTVNFQTLSTATGVNMTFESGAWVNISGLDSVAVDFQLNNAVQFDYVGENNSGFVYPVIYGPTATYQFKGNLFKGYLLARNVLLDTTITIQGAVTANYLLMSNSTKIEAIPGYSRCGTNNNQSYTLSISPNEDYSLTCKAQDVTFQVLDESGAAATDYSGYIQVSPYTNLTVVTGSGSSGLYQPNSSGLLELSLSASKTQDITLSAYLSTQTDTSDTVSGTYHFVPYQFSVDDQNVIASKPKKVSLKVEACDDNGNAVDVGYAGTPSYTSTWVAPTSGVGSLTLDNRTVSAGNATATLTMEDSGIKTVTLEDSSFNCSALGSDCPIKGNGTLKGSFTVYSRPWTFAICPSGTNQMNGNITDEESSGFTSAGSSFALLVKPIRWQSGGSISGEIASAAYCNAAVTQNFFSTNSPLTATVELTHNVAQPAGGTDGVLKSGESTSVTLPNSGGSNGYYNFADLTWSEVGVLRVKANTLRDANGVPAPYLRSDLSIQTGYRDIGRFYPAYLAITSNNWNYASGHTGFAYMAQPISYGFTVEAKNLSGQATTNYSQFTNDLKANIRLVAVDTSNDNEDMSSRVADYNDHFWSGSDWNSGADLTVNHSFTFARLETLQSPLTTKPDGPFTSGFGLQVTTRPDGVDFKDNQLTHQVNNELVSTDKAFPEQPDVRYGRLAFSDVGGNSITRVNVPLTAQYWNSSQFVTNDNDSGSLLSIDADKVCKSTIWPSPTQTSSSQLTGITGNVAVSSGQNHQIYAQPDSDSSLREQVRFWMRINESSPQVNEQNVDCGSAYLDQPWLQFNWRNNGDEDPSAVVTFGVYRGNDRVIYRGEPRINN